jgi:hypothetical protein
LTYLITKKICVRGREEGREEKCPRDGHHFLNGVNENSTKSKLKMLAKLGQALDTIGKP